MIPALLKVLWKPLAGIALVLAMYFTLQAHDASIEQRAYDRAVAERRAQDDAQLTAATTKAHAQEAALQEQIYQQSVQRQEEKVKYEKTIADLHADARRGNSGMRAPGACVRADTAPADPAAAGRPGAETGFVLLPETAGSVLDAASDLRQGVLDRNALIDLFNQCRAAANKE